MKSCTFELIVNILTYAIKNKNDAFSQKDFKNVVYTKEFDNYDINEKIAEGFEYLLKRGFLQLKSINVTFYEKYILPETIKINTENYTKVFKDLSKRIILMHEGKEMINDTYEVKDDYANIIECVDIVNAGFLSTPDKEEIKTTLSKILISFNVETKAHYSLLTILQLLELKSAIKIKIKTKECEFAANNVKFNFIQFNDNTMLISFDKCSFEIDNIDNILHIDTMDSLSLVENISKSLEILKTYPKNEVSTLIEYLDNYLMDKK